MGLCKFCNKWISQPEGRKKKEFCNSTCRSNYWYGKNKKGKPIIKEQVESKIPYVEATPKSYDASKINHFLADEPGQWQQPTASTYQLYVSKISKLIFPDDKTEYMEVIMADKSLSDKEREKLITSLKF